MSEIRWSYDWKEYAEKNEPEFMTRLGECHSRAHDVVMLATFIWSTNQNRDVIDCWDLAVEWITDWNNQFNLYDKIEAHKTGWYREFVDNITERIS